MITRREERWAKRVQRELAGSRSAGLMDWRDWRIGRIAGIGGIDGKIRELEDWSMQ